MWKIHLACCETHVSFMQHVWKTWLSPTSWMESLPINFWVTWPGDHVTTHVPSERSSPTLSRLQWKTTDAATVFPPPLSITFWSLSFFVHVALYLSPSFPLSLACVSIFHRPIPPLLCLLNLSSRWKDWEEEGGGKNEVLLLEYVSVGQIDNTCSSSWRRMWQT